MQLQIGARPIETLDHWASVLEQIPFDRCNVDQSYEEQHDHNQEQPEEGGGGKGGGGAIKKRCCKSAHSLVHFLVSSTRNQPAALL